MAQPNCGPLLVAEPLLVSTRDFAKLLGCSVRHVERAVVRGDVGPKPLDVWGRKLWRVQEIREWVAAECPGRIAWDNRERG